MMTALDSARRASRRLQHANPANPDGKVLRFLLAVALLTCVMMEGCLSFHTGPLPGEPQGETYLQLSDARVRYKDTGEQTATHAVVMIHGFASSMDVWDSVRSSIEDEHRVLSLDLKGFGWTDRPEGDYSPEAQAALVLDLMDARGIQTASLVAHSWGSSVALALALAAPERVERIVLYDAWVFEEQLPSTFFWARSAGVGEWIFGAHYKERAADKMALAFYDPTFITEELAETVRERLDMPGTVAAALAAVRGQKYAKIQKRYRNIRQPTMLFWGREDKVTLLQYGERLTRELPNSKLIVFPRCGHFPMWEAAAESTRELELFLRNQKANAPLGELRDAEPAGRSTANPSSPPNDDVPADAKRDRAADAKRDRAAEGSASP